MRGQIRIGRVFGVELRLHFSWIFIAILLTLSLSAHLREVNAAWSGALVWSAAVLTALAFFAALVAHELSHAAVARSRGLEVRGITLFALGGIAHMERDASDPRTEFWMGLAGPAMSVAIGAAALMVAFTLGWRYTATPDTPGMVMLVWFGWINLVLAGFNMVPGFPLDGGRVLRAGVWWFSGNREWATRVAAALGQLVAFALIFFGLVTFFRGGGFSGLWLAFIGLFLLEAARAAVAEITLTESLKGITVRDVMARECSRVERGTPLAEVAHDVLRTGRRCFFVMDDDHVAGLVTPREIRSVSQEQWPRTSAAEAMRPLEQVHKISPDAPVTDALQLIGREDVNQLPVIEGGTLRGVISRDQILRVVAARAELRAT